MALEIALDTNAYSDYMRGIPNRVKIVQSADRIHLPLIVLAELRAGFAAGNQQNENETRLDQFLSSPRVSVLPPDSETTIYYARLFAELKRQGKPIPTNDLWIAALVVQHRLPLCTNDTHFQIIDDIKTC